MPDNNPYCGRPAYSHAQNAHDCVQPPCDVATSGGTDPVVDTPTDPVVRPDCVALIYSSITDEVLQAYAYNETLDRYEAANGNGDTIIWDASLGWIVQTGNASYFPQDNEHTSPYGMFCSSSGEAVSTVACDKAQFPTPTLPEIVYEECVEVVYYSDGTEVIQEFSYDLTVERYTATNGDIIELNTNNIWVLNTSNRTYNISVESEQASGTYCNELDNEVASVVPCGKGVDPVPELRCVNSVYSTIGLIDPSLLGQFNTDVNGAFIPDNVNQGTLEFVSGIGWQYAVTISGVDYLFSGGTNPNIATGLYTDRDGNHVLFEDCV